MSQRRKIPDPVLLPVQEVARSVTKFTSLIQEENLQPSLTEFQDSRIVKVHNFLQQRSLKPSTQKGYRQDLQHFLRWTDEDWSTITPQQIRQFKAHLMRFDLETQPPKRVLSDASVRRILGTLKSFYTWMVQSDQIKLNPTLSIDLPNLKELKSNPFSHDEVKQIYDAAARSSFPERNLALIAVLSHSLSATEALALNLRDFEETHLTLREIDAKKQHIISHEIPLCSQASTLIEQYINWRGQQGEILTQDSPLFVSYSRRSWGNRLSYDGLRDVLTILEEATGLELHAHRFRDTFAVNLLLRGLNSIHLKSLMRQKSEVSSRRHASVLDENSATDALRAILEKSQDILIAEIARKNE